LFLNQFRVKKVSNLLRFQGSLLFKNKHFE